MKKTLQVIALAILVGVNCYVSTRAYREYRKYCKVQRANAVYAEMLGPSVRVSVYFEDDNNTGSGVVVYSAPGEKVGTFDTYVLTCQHVTVLDDGDDNVLAIDVDVFDYTALACRTFPGILIARDKQKDLALIKVEVSSKWFAAHFASSETFELVGVGDETFTVGAIYGSVPYPMPGVITRELYLGHGYSSNPVYPGNSGGPLYLSETCDLIGVVRSMEGFRQSDGKLSSVHEMAQYVGLDAIWSWLDSTGHAFIYRQTAREERQRQIEKDDALWAVEAELESDDFIDEMIQGVIEELESTYEEPGRTSE